MGRLIIDDTTIYEIDEDCMIEKERRERMEGTLEGKQKQIRNRAAKANRVKERPAP